MARNENGAEKGAARITHVEKVAVVVTTDRRDGLEAFDTEDFLSANKIFQRLAQLSEEKRTFSLAHIVHHASQHGHIEKLRRLFVDINFLTARAAHQRSGGLEALLRDYEAASLHPELAKTDLEAVRKALDTSQYLLKDDPSRLPQQLLARLPESLSPEVGELLSGSRCYGVGRRLLPLSPSLASSALERSLVFNGRKLRRLVLLPDGQRCIVADQSRVSVHDFATGSEIADLGPHGDEVTALVHDERRDRVAAALREGPILVWDVENRRQLFQLEGHGRATLALAFTPSGDLLSGGTDGAIHLWDLEGRRLARKLVENVPSIHALALLPNGTIVSGGGGHIGASPKDRRLHLWNSDGTAVDVFGEHEWEIHAIAVTSDGRWIVSAANQTLRVWDVEKRALSKSVEHSWRIHGLSTVPGRRLAVTTHSPEVVLWDLEAGREIRRLKAHHALVGDVKLTADGKRAVTVSEDQTLKIWSLDRALEREAHPGHQDEIRAMAFTADGDRLITASQDRTIGVWNAATGKLIQKLQGHEHWIMDLAISTERGWICSASWDGTVKIWNLDNGSLTRTLKIPGEGHLQAIALLPNGDCVAGSRDGRLYIWDPVSDSTQPAKTIETGQDAIEALKTLDGTLLLMTNREAILLDSGSGEERERIRIAAKIELPDEAEPEDIEWAERIDQSMRAVAALPDGHRILIGTGSGYLILWDLESRKEEARWPASTCGVTGIVTTRSGRFAVVTSGLPTYASDNTVRVWDLEERVSIAHFVGETPMLACALAQNDGLIIATGDAAGRAHVLEVHG